MGANYEADSGCLWIPYQYYTMGDFYECIIARYQATATATATTTTTANEAVARSVLYNVADAVRCLHEHGIVHCDIKPENIFLDGVKKIGVLGDYGAVVVLSSLGLGSCSSLHDIDIDIDTDIDIDIGSKSRTSTSSPVSVTASVLGDLPTAFTPQYAAPQFFSACGEPCVDAILGCHPTAVDVWAFGMCVYVACTGGGVPWECACPATDARFKEWVFLRAAISQRDLDAFLGRGASTAGSGADVAFCTELACILGFLDPLATMSVPLLQLLVQVFDPSEATRITMAAVHKSAWFCSSK